MMQLNATDIAKLVAVVVATIAITLLWVHRSSQTDVARTTANSCKIAVRMVVVHGILIWFLCSRNSVPVDAYIAFTAVVFLLCMAAWSGAGPTGADPITALIFIILVMPPFFLTLFVLGFPDRGPVMLESTASVPKWEPPPRSCDTGIAVSALRPMGTIELAGERFNACSAMGTIIDAGTPIRVCGQRGVLLHVEVLES